ncbi:energy-coupling factor transporter transmembrane component T family protein [Corynebacterium liangguodongii]|uniref:Cobalt ABC transporter permease n=1 Tax=Corynebacterium liangguodongii TaxID=2079535 RepID=A0A2S0WEN0_9CORY|nr:energy-coupling factor transporter transmembrane protein EcfT [Corynebacterium liangguodongii]AWB84200.1 cobalt ABC transporter permease [Corynebacterium liangguodongii]PWC00210.1 energy-coupling factor transporter transmembrane protein EcfT [Corynebacterium liangguodongii]
MRYAPPLGVYSPGHSWLHRLPAGLKLIVVLVLAVGTAALPTEPWHGVAVLWCIAAAYATARIPFGLAVRQIAPVVPLIALLGAYLAWQDGAAAGLVTSISVLASLAAANLVTLTTTIEEMMDAIEAGLAPLSKLGVNVEAISLAISLTIRLVPLMAHTVSEVADARAARGAGLSLTAFATPVVVRSIRRAQLMGDALLARGAGD